MSILRQRRPGQYRTLIILAVAVGALLIALVGMATRKASNEYENIEGAQDMREIFGGVRQLDDRLGSDDAPVQMQVFLDAQSATYRDQFLDTIPALLTECRRVLKPTGRLGVTSMATVESGDKKSVLEKTYIWMHTHFPHIVDCQPIPLEDLVQKAGFKLLQQERIDLFTMPVAIVVAQPE